MAKRPRRSDGILGTLTTYANENGMELSQFSETHCRLADSFTSLDVWPTTGRYYVGKTSYHKQGGGIVERQGEKGGLPFGGKAITEFLDTLFFASEMEEPMQDPDIKVKVPAKPDFDVLMGGMPPVLESETSSYYLYLIKGATGKYRADYSNTTGKPLLVVEADTPTEAITQLQKKVSKYIRSQ